MSLTNGNNAHLEVIDCNALRIRLASAEADTHQIMQQLKEMGFSSSQRDLISKQNEQNNTEASTIQDVKVANGFTCHYHDKESDQQFYSLQEDKGNTFFQMPLKQSKKTESENYGSISSKHRPITPLSLQGLTLREDFEKTSKSSSNFMPKTLQSSMSNSSMHKARSDILEQKDTVGRRELEQELIRVKRLLSQVEEELQNEAQGKQKALEESHNLKSLLANSNTSKAQLEISVEELTVTKQKLGRRLSELREELSRESSLRASLEESHATLLSRLHEMETAIESLRSECKTHTSYTNGLKTDFLHLKDELSNEISKRKGMEDTYHISVTEKDKLLLSTSKTQADNQRMSHDLMRLQTQYTELIGQLEQTQSLVDHLTSSNKKLEEEKYKLENKVQNLTKDLEKMTCMQDEIKESENRLSCQKSTLEGDLNRLNDEREKLMKDNLEKKKKIDSLDSDLRSVKQSLAKKNQEFTTAADGLEYELAGLKRQLEDMENEKQLVLKDKENLLEEVNQTVDTLVSERSRLQTELQACCVEAETLKSTCSRLEQDKALLLERLSGLQHQQVTQRKVEETLNEMMEQKNRLAYDNGKLQSTINQLQKELDEAAKEQGEISQLRKLNQNIQAKYTKSQQEISEYKISLQRSDSQIRAASDDLERKDKELKAALYRTEEAEMEAGKLRANLEVLEGRQLHKVSNYQKNMEEAKSVNQEIASTLEAVMSSHSQLQTIVENLQIELGKRDSLINQLKSSRNKESEALKLSIKKREEQLETLKGDLKKEREKNGKRVTKEITEIRKQNESLSTRNQELVKSNTELRQKVTEMEREKEEMKTKLSGQRHKMDYLHKAKKQLEENLNKMKAVREDIEELEQMRNEYMRKNKEQGETIGKFISQISSLQDEMRQLANAHINAQQLLKMKEEALEKERKIREEMRKRYSESKKRELELNRNTQNSDEKLQEVHSESLEISKHLQEAHEWFKGKFDKLQTEITASKQIQAKLERENVDQRTSLEVERTKAQDAAERAKEMLQFVPPPGKFFNVDQRTSLEVERTKAQDAAERAKEMLQNSRMTISRLAEYAELAGADTKHQLAELRAELFITPTATKLAIMNGES